MGLDSKLRLVRFLVCVATLLSSAELVDIFRKRPQDFTRKSKMDFLRTLYFVIFRFCSTTNSEAAFFYANINCGSEQITRQSIFDRIKCLSSSGWETLMQKFSELFYFSSGLVKKYKGYLLWATDSSSIEYPDCAESREILGVHTGNHTSKESAAGKVLARCGGLLDILNGFFVDYVIKPFKCSERSILHDQLLKYQSILQSVNGMIIILGDRGYISLALMILMDKLGYKICIRGKRIDYKELVKSMLTNDENIIIKATKAVLRRIDDPTALNWLLEHGSFSVRVVKRYYTDPKTGRTELWVYFTNLSSEEFSTAEIIALYTRRWRIETTYRTLKVECEWERHTSGKVEIANNLMYGKVFHYNLNGIIRMEFENVLVKSPTNKYEPCINEQALFEKLIAENLLGALYYSDFGRLFTIINNIDACLHVFIGEIRPDRHYDRWGRPVTTSHKYRFRIDGRSFPKVSFINGCMRTCK